MVTAIATSTEMQNNFGKYLKMIMEGNEVIVTRNGKEVGRLIPHENVVSYLSDSLVGIISYAGQDRDARYESLDRKYGDYESTDRH